MAVLVVFCKVIEITLSLVTTCMFLRAILPIFLDVEASRFYMLLCVVTEIFIVPVRAILYKLNIGQDTPIDMSFFVTYLLLVVVQWFLPVI